MQTLLKSKFNLQHARVSFILRKSLSSLTFFVLLHLNHFWAMPKCTQDLSNLFSVSIWCMFYFDGVHSSNHEITWNKLNVSVFQRHKCIFFAYVLLWDIFAAIRITRKLTRLNSLILHVLVLAFCWIESSFSISFWFCLKVLLSSLFEYL